MPSCTATAAAAAQPTSARRVNRCNTPSDAAAGRVTTGRRWGKLLDSLQPSRTIARCIVLLVKAWQVVCRLVTFAPKSEYNEYVAMDEDVVMLVDVGLHVRGGSHGI